VTTFGVLQFPGSCDERDALAACERVGEARMLWHGEADLRGVDAVVVPGGFSYGDYLRAGAIAQFSPVMGAVREFADAGGPVLGICNGFQVLCEARLLPGALLPNAGLRFVCRQVDVMVENAGTAFSASCEPGERLSIPVKHMSGRYFAPPDELAALEAAGRIVFRYAPGHNPNGSSADIAGVANEGGNVVGLMPHPEHAVDALTGSADGLALFACVARPASEPASALAS
jgi:phosphoribosylformylglycinamidine synthase